MEIYIEKIKKILRALISRGFFHIFIGNTLVKLISLGSAMLLPRVLASKDLYGILATVDNINSYLILINGAGLSLSVLRFCAMAEAKKDKTAIFKFCLKGGLLVNCIILIIFVPIVIFSGFFAVGNYTLAKQYILISCLIPTLNYLLELAMVYMRANLLNRQYSRISVIYTALYAGFQIVLAYICSLKGVFIGRYLALSLIILIAFYMLLKNKTLVKETSSLGKFKKIEIVKYGIGAMVTNAFSLIMPLNETLVVNLLLEDLTATAHYKAASMIPSNLQYIATSVVVFIYPYFAKNTGNGAWIEKNVKRVLLGMIILMVPIIIIGYVLSPNIIALVYGNDYSQAVYLMQPMWIAFGVNSIIRVPIGNILAALGELKFNITLSIIISLIHFVLDFLFISRLGIDGAAYALMITYTVSSIASIVYIFYKSNTKWKNSL